MSFLAKLLFIAAAAAAVAIPPLKARVTDLTGTLNQTQRSALEQTLAEFETRKGSQIAVLIVPTTQPETPVEYGVRVYDAWKLGRKGIDDGLLLLVAKEDRKVWIVVGRGAEGALPDAAVKRIVEDDITPRFKQGDFYGGVRAGTDRIMRTLEGEPLPPPRAVQSSRGFQHIDWLLPALIMLFIAGGILRSIFGRFIGSGLLGGLAGFVAWIAAGSMLIAVLVGLFLFVTGLFGSASMLPRGGWGGGRGGGGWGSGGWGGGGWGGGSSGGGGSGGGGGTAGGGAGGSW